MCPALSHEGKGKPFTADDVRFTTKAGVLYAIVLGKPTPPLRNRSLGTTAELLEKLIASIRRLGSDERVMWSRAADALAIASPAVFAQAGRPGFVLPAAFPSARRACNACRLGRLPVLRLTL